MTLFQAVCEDCGWRGKRTQSEPVAAYACRRHRCSAQHVRDARAARVAARDAASGPRRDCEHKVAVHVHGSHAAYVLDACRCRPCRRANRAYEARRRKDRAYGRAAYVDAQPARDRIEELRQAGVGLKVIAAHAGLSTGLLSKLVYGKPRPDGARRPSRRVRRATLDRLLALDPADLALPARGARVPSAGTRRRVQALATLGWSVAGLARLAGVDRQRLDGAMRRDLTEAFTARAVAAVYDRLWDTRAPERTPAEATAAARARARAAACRWLPPMAWDDDTIDVPRARAGARARLLPAGAA